MEKIVLIGMGGHFLSVADTIINNSEFEIVEILDTAENIGKQIGNYSVTGTDEKLPFIIENITKYAFVTIGSIHSVIPRKKIISTLSDLGFIIPNIIDPTAVISSSVEIGQGNYIGKNVVLNAFAKIGSHNILNTSCVVEHSCQIKDFNHVSINSTLCGDVTMGNNNFVGAGTVITNGVHLSNNSFIKAGSVIKSDPKNNKVLS